MKFRLKWISICRHMWVLQAAPSTSSDWATIAEAKWKWVLRLYARWYMVTENSRIRKAAAKATVEEFEL